jgi:two-component system chemotaxis response regulator CheY
MKPIVLIAHPEKDLRKVYSFVLSKDYEVVEAGDGLEALKQLWHHNPDVALLYDMLPQRSGFELAKRIKESPRFFPAKVVLLTSNTLPLTRERANAIEVDETLLLPCSNEELNAAVRRQIVVRNALMGHRHNP